MKLKIKINYLAILIPSFNIKYKTKNYQLMTELLICLKDKKEKVQIILQKTKFYLKTNKIKMADFQNYIKKNLNYSSRENNFRQMSINISIIF